MTDEGLIRPAELGAWLDVNVPELGEGRLPSTSWPAALTMLCSRIDRGGRSMVLRRPPARLRPDSDKIMVREAPVLGGRRRPSRVLRAPRQWQAQMFDPRI